jgi:hypothetical protein
MFVKSMGISGSEIRGTLPFFRPYIVGIFPEIKAIDQIGLVYGKYLQSIGS